MREDAKMLAKAKKVINKISESETGQGADFSDLKAVIVGTMRQKDARGNQHDIKLSVDLVRPSLSYFIDDELIEKESFLSVREVCEELEDFDFDVLVADMVYRVWTMGEDIERS